MPPYRSDRRAGDRRDACGRCDGAVSTYLVSRGERNAARQRADLAELRKCSTRVPSISPARSRHSTWCMTGARWRSRRTSLRLVIRRIAKRPSIRSGRLRRTTQPRLNAVRVTRERIRIRLGSSAVTTSFERGEGHLVSAFKPCNSFHVAASAADDMSKELKAPRRDRAVYLKAVNDLVGSQPPGT